MAGAFCAVIVSLLGGADSLRYRVRSNAPGRVPPLGGRVRHGAGTHSVSILTVHLHPQPPFWESGADRGSRRGEIPALGCVAEPGLPAMEGVVEDGGADLDEEVGGRRAASTHLLFLDQCPY